MIPKFLKLFVLSEGTILASALKLAEHVEAGGGSWTCTLSGKKGSNVTLRGGTRRSGAGRLPASIAAEVVVLPAPAPVDPPRALVADIFALATVPAAGGHGFYWPCRQTRACQSSTAPVSTRLLRAGVARRPRARRQTFPFCSRRYQITEE